MAHRWKHLAYRALSALLAIGFAAPALPAAQHSGADADNAVQAEIARHLQAEGLPGAVWTLVTPADGIRAGAAGLKHAGHPQAMTSDARVHVGSVAKTVLAIGVLRLVTQGKLSLDTEVGSLLPALRFDNPWQASDPVRLRHLLEHTAGLNNFRFAQISACARTPTRRSPQRSAMSRWPSTPVPAPAMCIRARATICSAWSSKR